MKLILALALVLFCSTAYAQNQCPNGQCITLQPQTTWTWQPSSNGRGMGLVPQTSFRQIPTPRAQPKIMWQAQRVGLFGWRVRYVPTLIR